MSQPATRFPFLDVLGPLGVILANLGEEPFRVAKGARNAQAIVAPVVQVRFAPADRLPGTGRGTGGPGSTREG